MAKQILKSLRLILLALVTIVFVWFIIKNQDNFSFILSIQLGYLIPIVIFSLLKLFLANSRFFLILRSLSNKITFIECFKYFTVGRFLNKIVPHGGGVYRALILKKKKDINYKKYASILLSFTWMNIMLSLCFAILIIGLDNPEMTINGINVFLFFILILILGFMVIPILSFLSRILNFQKSSEKYQKLISQSWEMVNITLNILRNKKLFIYSTIIIILNNIADLSIILFCFRSINIVSNITVLAVFMITLKLSSLIKLTPGNIGIREFLYGFLSNSVGFTIANGIAVSLILRLVTFFVLGLLTIIILLTDKYHTKTEMSNVRTAQPER